MTGSVTNGRPVSQQGDAAPEPPVAVAVAVPGLFRLLAGPSALTLALSPPGLAAPDAAKAAAEEDEEDDEEDEDAVPPLDGLPVDISN